jgi:hypothetical protein
MSKCSKRDARAEAPVDDENDCGDGEPLDDVSDADDGHEPIAEAEAALGRAVQACRRGGPSRACDALEALVPVMRALKPKRELRGPEPKPVRTGCPAKPLGERE